MQAVIDRVEIVDGAIYLIDSVKEETIELTETDDGADLVFSTENNDFYLIVDSKTLTGSLRVLISKGERARVNKR